MRRSGSTGRAPLYSEAERVALDFALAAASVPNEVTDEMFAGLRKRWNDTQMVEIVATIAVFGFLNRWNDTFATPLEAEPTHVGERHPALHARSGEKHRRNQSILQEQRRIDRHRVEIHREVQMRPGGTAARTDLADQRAGGDDGRDTHFNLIQMRVER